MKYLICLCALVLALATPALAADDAAAAFKTQVLPVLQKHCAGCHGPQTQEAKVNLSGARSLEQLMQEKHLWFRVLDQLEFGTMPPEGEPRPTANERAAVISWIKGELTDSLTAERQVKGRSKFRRLSRAEYSNAFEDLFGYRPDPDLLPEDGRVDGYTKVSAALPMSMDGAYGYYKIARELVDRWVLERLPKPDDPRHSRVTRAAAMESGQSPGHTLVLPDGWFVSFNTDDTSGRLKYRGVRVPGRHKLRIHAYGYQTDQPMQVGIYAGKTHAYPQEIELVDILEVPPGKPAIVETELYLKERAGLRVIPFGLGVQVPKNHQASKCKGPGLALQWLEDEAPARPILADRWLLADLPEDLVTLMRKRRIHLRQKGPYSYSELSREDFLALMRKTFKRVGARVLRRDLTDAELEELLAPVAADLAAEKELKEVFRAGIAKLLTWPEFFCVVESPGQLSDFELASRLSFFLWNSTPDEELLAVARAGKLGDPDTLRKQTDRLLDDPKSQRFVQDFLDQWLELNAINDTTPDKKLYPEYDDVLKFTSLEETRATFARILRENRSVRDFAAPDWMLANRRLAKHYGLEGIAGVELQAIPAPEDSPFGGLWTQPAILKVTADGSSTSPVKRGVWISERLLGVPISPPPPNIEPINPDTRGATTIREQLALHSKHASCAHCHKKFDPYGFALESFDVMGQFRTKYRVLDEELSALPARKRKGKRLWHDGLEVDSSGTTPEGREFEDIVELRQLLAQQPEKLAWGVTWHLATYATATPSGPLDRRAIQKIVDSAKADDYGLRSLVHGLVQSELFRWK